MTIRELIAATTSATEIKIYWGSNGIDLLRDDDLQVDAYGDYLIKEFAATAENQIEAVISFKPLRKGDA